MEKTELTSIIEKIIDDKIAIIILTNILVFLLTLSGTYITIRIKNRAMIADLEKLTSEVENVKAKYSKEFEIFKGNQTFVNPEKVELYKKLKDLKLLMIDAKNNAGFNGHNEMFISTMDIIKTIGANSIFKNLSSENDVIINDYNKWVKDINESKSKGESTYSINFDSTFNVIEKIQDKLIIR